VVSLLVPRLMEEYVVADVAGQFGAARKRRAGERIEQLRALVHDPAIDAAETIEELRAAWPFGEPATIGVMARRALERGLLVA
jgi:hypothetical protein